MTQETIKINISKLDYYPNPAEIYHHYCHNKPETILLESSDIDSKANLQSLIVLQSAIKITASDHKIIYHALTNSGEKLLDYIERYFQTLTIENVSRETSHQLAVTFLKQHGFVSEDERLKLPSVFDGLRAITSISQKYSQQAELILTAGMFSYELVAQFEDIHVNNDKLCQDYVFYLAEHYIKLNHQTQSSELLSLHLDNDLSFHQSFIKNYSTHQFTPITNQETIQHKVHYSHNDEEFEKIILKMQEHIDQGDVFQVVPSRKFSIDCKNPLSAYQQLKKTNPSPYLFYMQDSDFTLFGASPESAIKYSSKSQIVEIYPIAGTRPRGYDENGHLNRDLDSRIELSLRSDPKELAEHLMLVDLARNDVARIAKVGSRYVANLTKVDRYSQVMHLVSRVVGELRDDLDAFHAYQASMNMGTLTGSPKIRAMQLISEQEKMCRGSYGGAVGYFTGVGDLDTCIVIRSAFVKDHIAYVQAGAGIVKDSNPVSELEETKLKARAVIRAILQSHHSKEIF